MMIHLLSYVCSCSALNAHSIQKIHICRRTTTNILYSVDWYISLGQRSNTERGRNTNFRLICKPKYFLCESFLRKFWTVILWFDYVFSVWFFANGELCNAQRKVYIIKLIKPIPFVLNSKQTNITVLKYLCFFSLFSHYNHFAGKFFFALHIKCNNNVKKNWNNVLPCSA